MKPDIFLSHIWKLKWFNPSRPKIWSLYVVNRFNLGFYLPINTEQHAYIELIKYGKWKRKHLVCEKQLYVINDYMWIKA